MTTDYRAAAQRIVDTLFEVHPKLDYRTPMSLLQAKARRCIEQTANCDTPGAFHRLIAGFVHTIGDPHVWFDMPRKRVAAPAWLLLVDGLPVVGDPVTDGLPVSRGDAILRVNGRDARSLLYERLERLSYVQGGWGLQRAADGLLYFDVDEAPGDEVDLLIASGGGQVRRVTLPLWPSEAKAFATFERNCRADWLRRLMHASWRDDADAAVLTYRSCQDRHSDGVVRWGAEVGLAPGDIPTMADVCAHLFPEMRRRGTQRLVIDLRANGGGSDRVTAPLYPYLFDGDLRISGISWRITPTAQSLRKDLRERPLGDHHVPPRATPCPGAPDRFAGRVTALIDAGTSSSGEGIATVLRDNGRATFIGEPTGGGPSAGNVLSVPIPEVGGTLHCGCSLFHRPGPEQGAVYPDVLVHPTLADFRAGRDVVLETALRL